MSGLTPVAAPFLAAVAALAAAGAAKTWRPDYTARALSVAGIAVGRRLVRAGALAEVALAVSALAAPGPLTGSLVAAAYAGFAGFVLVAVSRDWPLSSCGCFGRPDSRPGYAHAALDAAAAVAAAWWAADAPVDLGRAFTAQPWHGAPLALVGAVIAALAYLVWTNPLAEASP